MSVPTLSPRQSPFTLIEADPGSIAPPADDPLTARVRAIWSAGDFRAVARGYASGAALFVDRLTLEPGTRVLDVACGAGGLSLPAARAGARVTGIDIAAYLIDAARAEADQAGLTAQFDVGDAEEMPYPDQSFDVVMTMFGAMFAPRPARAAAELLRVTRKGGLIAMANWTPTGFIGRMLRAHVALVPPPPDLASPLAWGDETVVRERFGNRVSQIVCTPRPIGFRFPVAPSEVTDLFATAYGPTLMALRALDAKGQQSLRGALTQLWTDHNVATDGTTLVWSEYLEVLARVV